MSVIEPPRGPVTRRGRGAGVSVSGYSRTQRVSLPEHSPARLPEPIPESALFPIVAREFAAQGFTSWRDVSFLGSFIDLYAKSADETSIAVELKVADWRRALRQATRVRNSATRVYVGLWAPYIHRALTPEAVASFEAVGVGLISINGATQIRVEAACRSPRYPDRVILPKTPNYRPK